MYKQTIIIGCIVILLNLLKPILTSNSSTNFATLGNEVSLFNNCKTLSSAEQPIFGPYIWTALHIISVNYPDDPTIETQNAAIHFIKGFPWMIPCGNCGFHFDQFIHYDYMPELNYNIDKKLREITKNKSTLVTFFTEAHNNVTKHTNPYAKLWTPKETLDYYSYGHTCVSPNITPWEEASLKKSKHMKCKTWVHPISKKKYCKIWEKCGNYHH